MLPWHSPVPSNSNHHICKHRLRLYGKKPKNGTKLTISHSTGLVARTPGLATFPGGLSAKRGSRVMFATMPGQLCCRQKLKMGNWVVTVKKQNTTFLTDPGLTER